MSKIDESYHELLNNILQNGYLYDDPNREGVQRLEIPSYTFKHKFSDGFPAITTKKLHYKNVVTELIWFLRGDTNIKYLVDNGCNIWNKDAYNYYLKIHKKNRTAMRAFKFDVFVARIKDDTCKGQCTRTEDRNYVLGDLGPVYGEQWRYIKEPIYEYGNYVAHKQIDQISNLIKGLKEKPLGTEHIVNSWNASDLADMALPPCHYGFQVVVRPLNYQEKDNIVKVEYYSLLNKDKSNIPEVLRELNKNIPQYGFELHWTQRSVDTFLGLPYNIASYATLALILEKITGYKALSIQGDLKKVHLYDNSLDAVKKQLSRDSSKYSKCELKIVPDIENSEETYTDLFELLENDDFKLNNYESYPAINVEMLERNT